MDNEIKDMLTKLLEGQTRIETKVTELDTKVAGLDTKVSKLDTKATELDAKVAKLDTKVAGLEVEVKKSSIKLEEIEKKIDLIAEVQTAHKEQNERGFEKVQLDHGNANTLISGSLKTVSGDVVEVKKRYKRVKIKV